MVDGYMYTSGSKSQVGQYLDHENGSANFQMTLQLTNETTQYNCSKTIILLRSFTYPSGSLASLQPQVECGEADKKKSGDKRLLTSVCFWRKASTSGAKQPLQNFGSLSIIFPNRAHENGTKSDSLVSKTISETTKQKHRHWQKAWFTTVNSVYRVRLPAAARHFSC